MKLMLITDLEAVAGVLNYDDWCHPGGRYFDKAKRLLTLEVNAAVDGFFAGSATEVMILDGHGQGGIDPELLDERAQLQRGAEAGYPMGLDDSFAGVGWIGQHAKVGTDYSHLTHTQGFHYIDLAINGTSIGEYGQIAFCAMEMSVPCILACGEKAFCLEASALTPGVVGVWVKRGLRADGLEHMDAEEYRRAKEAAVHLAPLRARTVIREGATRAALRLREQPDSFSYPDLKPPFVRTARFRKEGDRQPWSARDEHPESITELLNMPFTPSPEEAPQA